MDHTIKILFFAIIVKPIILFFLGLNIKDRKKLPKKGPAVIVANHNSHLDTLVIMSLFPLRDLYKIRPVGAEDYFFNNGKLLKWVAQKCMDIIPFNRSGSNPDALFSACHDALNHNDILIFFPEGSRGKPEQIGKVKKGIYYMIKDKPETPVIPILIHGLGKALPKGEALFVPFNCDIIIGDEIKNKLDSANMVKEINAHFFTLSKYCITLNKNDTMR